MNVSSKPSRWSLELLGAAYERLDHDNGDGLAAGLAFGALLSIAPLMLVVVAIAGLVLGDGGAHAQLSALVRDSLGERAVPLVAQLIDDARTWSGGATAIGVVLFVIGSARLVGLVDAAFQMVFDGPSRPKLSFAQSIRRYFTTQAKSIAVTLAAGLLMVVSLVVRAVSESALGGDGHGVVAVLWPFARELLSFAFWFAALAAVYRIVPPVRLDRGDVVCGAVVSAAVVSLTLLLLRLGASVLDFGAAYGAAGAVVAMLLTLYVVSQLFLFGAELTAELASRRGLAVRSSRDGCPERVAPIRRGAR